MAQLPRDAAQDRDKSGATHTLPFSSRVGRSVPTSWWSASLPPAPPLFAACVTDARRGSLVVQGVHAGGGRQHTRLAVGPRVFGVPVP